VTERSDLVVSVVTPTFRRPERLERLLDALAKQELDGDFEVIIVDDCSPDATGEVLARRAAAPAPYSLRAMRTPINSGPAAARNLGWQAASAPLIAFIDDDCVPQPGWLQAGVDHLRKHERVGVVQGLTLGPPEAYERPLEKWEVRREVVAPTPHFEACSIFYRRDALAATGGFDEELGWWGEDVRAGWRVLDGGWERGWEPEARAEHDLEQRGFRWHLRNSYLGKNEVRIAALHPGYRAQFFWKPWAIEKRDAAFAAAIVGLVGALWWRPLALIALPYLWWRRPSWRKPAFFKVGAQHVAIDAARLAGHLEGSVRNGIFTL
jgi:glycosyltransferase involved in cell wall biosynthesis